MPIIRTRALRKVFRTVRRVPGVGGALRTLLSPSYEDKVAVSGVDMDIEAGELVGYIGPNGAGKSTTIKMLTGILVPTSGTIAVAGIVPHEQRQQNARNIGVVFGQRSQLYWDLPLIESFELLRAIYSVPEERYQRNLRTFIDILEMEPFIRTPVRQLSLGQRMRGDFAAALLHDPQIIYLDEPTIGLDVIAKGAIRDFVRHINQERGATVILTTHDLADVERLCRRIIIIDNGAIIYNGGIEHIKEQYGTHRTLILTLTAPDPNPQLDGAEVVSNDHGVVRYRFDRRRARADQLIRQATERFELRDVTIEEPDLESIIRRIYLEGYQQERTPS